MHRLGIRRDGVQQQGPVAMRGFALHAQQRAGLLGCEREHFGRLGDGFGQFQLPRLDSLEVRVAPGARRSAALGRRAERFQMHIVDAGFA